MSEPLPKLRLLTSTGGKVMSWTNLLRIAAVTALALVVGAGTAAAQKKTLKEQLVGSWLVATADNIRPDGSRFQGFGHNPKGILMFQANGWFSFQRAGPANLNRG
jgi:hypothetical protein